MAVNVSGWSDPKYRMATKSFSLSCKDTQNKDE